MRPRGVGSGEALEREGARVAGAAGVVESFLVDFSGGVGSYASLIEVFRGHDRRQNARRPRGDTPGRKEEAVVPTDDGTTASRRVSAC